MHVFDTVGAADTAVLLKLETYRSDYGVDPGKIALDFKGQDSNNAENFARIAQATVNDTDYGHNSEATSNLIFGMTYAGTYNERMILTGTGRLGLGTLNPTTNLHVLGTTGDSGATTVRIGGSEVGVGNHTPKLEFVESTTTAGAMHYGFSITGDGASTNDLHIKHHENSTSGAVAIAIERENGNVAINRSDAAVELDVGGTGWFRQASADGVALRLGQLDSNPGTPLYYVKCDDTSNDQIQIYSVRHGSNFKLARSSPAGGNISVMDVTGNGGGSTTLQLYDQASPSSSTTVGTKIKFNTRGDSYFSGGGLGIGTQSPTHQLHVIDSAGSYSDGDKPIAVIQAATDHRHLLKIKNTNANATAGASRAGIDLDAANHEDSARVRAILDVRSRTSGGGGGDTNLTTPFDFSIYTNNHDTITVSDGAQESSSVPGGTLALHIDENQHVGVGTSSTTHNFTSDVGAIGSNTYAGHFIGSLTYTPPNTSTFNQVSNGVLIQAGGFNAVGTSYALMVQDRASTELFAVNGNTGAVRFHDAFTFPTTDGQENQVLKTNGNGTVSWQNDTSTVQSIANFADNRVITASDADSLNGEASMTFDGSLLTVTGNIQIAGSDPILKRDQYDYLDFDDDSQTYTGGTNATTLSSVSDVAIRTNANDGGGGLFTIVTGNSSPTQMLQINTSGDATFAGSVSATTKSFDIKHPTKEGMRLHHGSLEGPEHGVYVRGHATESIIELPEYWTGLVDEKTITVQLTANGRFQKLYIEKVENNKVYLRNASWFSNKIDCYYMINATRKDIEQFEVEYGNP